MPKIEVYRDTLLHYVGKSMSDAELEKLFPSAKAELDEPADVEGIMKVELNDTNRPDLWSTAGLARQLRTYLGGTTGSYRFFSSAEKQLDTGDRTVVVDSSVREIRPWVVGFAITGKGIDEPMLKDLIQTQEKLTWNYGRKRKSIAMGVYRTDLMQYPVHYAAVDPDTTSFQPLQSDRVMTMREMLSEHPKGQEFGSIVADLERFPLLTDDRGEVLSFPPVINSATIGAVELGDENLFIELTGTDMDSLLLTASIVACDVSDAGFTVLPVKIVYPYDTSYGREVVVPYYFQKPQQTTLNEINGLLGSTLSVEEVQSALTRMGIVFDLAGETFTVAPPEWRNDFLHAVDIVEDVMIGRGMDSFEPVMPHEFTVGRLHPIEIYGRKLESLVIGLGFQEMIFNYLGSGRDYIERWYPEAEWETRKAECVRILNPMSENFEYVRPSVLPSLLSAESVSGNAVYPHHLFEVGKIAVRDDSDVSGTKTYTSLGLVSADREAGFNLTYSQIASILFYVGLDYELLEIEDNRFIPGRVASVIEKESRRELGRLGEIHPRVLESWGIQVPATGAEFYLERMMDYGEKI